MDDQLTQLSAAVGTACQQHQLATPPITIAAAESCTGGWVAQVITHTAGSSAWFDRGFVTYSNQAKIDMLGVRAATLEAHGAVSLETAGEMAVGALINSQAQISLAITGIAEPPVAHLISQWAPYASLGASRNKMKQQHGPSDVCSAATEKAFVVKPSFMHCKDC